jgi:hypothetical protein
MTEYYDWLALVIFGGYVVAFVWMVRDVKPWAGWNKDERVICRDCGLYHPAKRSQHLAKDHCEIWICNECWKAMPKNYQEGYGRYRS